MIVKSTVGEDIAFFEVDRITTNNGVMYLYSGFTMIQELKKGNAVIYTEKGKALYTYHFATREPVTEFDFSNVSFSPTAPIGPCVAVKEE